MASELRYPRNDLESSIQVADKIAERGAGATVSNHELAALLGYSGVNNGTYLNRVAAARLFGLIEGNANAIKATERAEGILSPDYPATADRLRLEAFKDVPLYAAFLDGFRGRELPAPSGMINALVTRYRVPAKDAKSVLPRLLASAEQAGLFRVAGASRLIEPTLPVESEPPSQLAQTEATATAEPLPVRTAAIRARFPKIIEGALDLMPSGPPWDQDEYEQWLSFFDQACRVYYRIGRKKAEE